MSARGQRCSGVDRFRRKSVYSKFVIPAFVIPAGGRAATQPRDLRFLRRLHNRGWGGKDTARPRVALRIREMIAATSLQ